MHRIATVIAIAWIAGGFMPGAAVVAVAGEARAPSAARGKQLYHAVGCVHCHGTEGQGGNSGVRLAPGPLPAAAIAQFIRATGTTMPAYSAALLGDADVADIAAFLATIPASRPVGRIPVLRDLQAPGQ